MSSEIREVIDAMLAHCADDIVVFDMVPPLSHEGADAVRKIWETTLGAFEPPIDYEIHHLAIEASGDVAFARSLNRFRNNWVRATLGLRKIGGQWKLAHQHVSVPFDMERGKALLDLEP